MSLDQALMEFTRCCSGSMFALVVADVVYTWSAENIEQEPMSVETFIYHVTVELA